GRGLPAHAPGDPARMGGLGPVSMFAIAVLGRWTARDLLDRGHPEHAGHTITHDLRRGVAGDHKLATVILACSGKMILSADTRTRVTKGCTMQAVVDALRNVPRSAIA